MTGRYFGRSWSAWTRRSVKAKLGANPTAASSCSRCLSYNGSRVCLTNACNTEITDHLWFMRFLGVELAGNVPEARTVWTFRESLKERQLTDAWFDRLNQALVQMGIELKNGTALQRAVQGRIGCPPFPQVRPHATKQYSRFAKCRLTISLSDAPNNGGT